MTPPPTLSRTLPPQPPRGVASSPPTEDIGPPAGQTPLSSRGALRNSPSPSPHPAGGGLPDGGRQRDRPPAIARIHQLRSALAAAANRRLELAGQPLTRYCGRRSQGRSWSAIRVQAFCQCGWATTWQPWASGPAASVALQTIEAALDDHRQTGHLPFPSDGSPDLDRYHQRCGWFHGFQDTCPSPPDLPAGHLARIDGAPTLGDPTLSLDRLAAIQAQRAWLDDQQLQAIIGARLAHCTWPDINGALDVTTQEACAKWGALVGRYEAVGILAPDAATGANQQTDPQRYP